jgi:hypothetical protein
MAVLMLCPQRCCALQQRQCHGEQIHANRILLAESSALTLANRLIAKEGLKQFLPHTNGLRERLVLRGGHIGESTQFCIDTPTYRLEVTRPAPKNMQGPQVPWTSRVEAWVEGAWTGTMNASQINAALLEAREGMAEVRVP